MIIGVPKEIKNNENRVALTPSGVSLLTNEGHQVYIERHAGVGSGFSDEEYIHAGAGILEVAGEVWAKSDLIMKVKEPQPEEYPMLREGLILFTYLHLAAEPALAEVLREKGVIAIAYETVEMNHALPLLIPMSEVAGRMSVQIGAQFLEKPYGGKGILLGGVPGVKRGRVTIIGGGVVGMNAAKIAAGLGAEVTILDLDPLRLRQLEEQFGASVQTMMSNPQSIDECVRRSDLVIGAVLIPGAKAPKLVREETVKAMVPGSVIIDVAIDQGGIFETIDRVTLHSDPTYVKHGVVHYAVANMPGAVPRTSTIALVNATAPYALEIANKGVLAATAGNLALRKGVNVAGGAVTHPSVARDLNYTYVPVEQALKLPPA
ncbi:alanine dehydrogenase [Paenibacillus antibioticophila]|uniref:Alanine dehydrogenase n=1 Tax=Paenibacillus antibioticophila TaxID=1274374 RepID=A0A919XR14_9BACL|nr:alanine dehydrogenase [Paenibacillus antibioticophila]GIO35933.1 alanine dehydrogenase [Paenibacillus antibioticophila]